MGSLVLIIPVVDRGAGAFAILVTGRSFERRRGAGHRPHTFMNSLRDHSFRFRSIDMVHGTGTRIPVVVLLILLTVVMSGIAAGSPEEGASIQASSQALESENIQGTGLENTSVSDGVSFVRLWNRLYGGDRDDVLSTVRKTPDGGFAAIGYTGSGYGQVTGNHGLHDIWVVRMRSDGTMMWGRCYGGSSYDYGSDIALARDGGFVIAGYTMSDDGQAAVNHGGFDIWVARIGPGGTIVWKRTIGGPGDDVPSAVIEDSDGNFVIYGETKSNIFGNHGNSDLFVIKLSKSGSILWKKCFGGTSWEYSPCGKILQRQNGNYVFIGTTSSTGGQVDGFHGATDIWMGEVSRTGNLVWQHCFGGTGYDGGRGLALDKTLDKGIVFGGYSSSDDGDVKANPGNSLWVVKLDVSRNITWQRCIPGVDIYDIAQVSGGQYILAGAGCPAPGGGCMKGGTDGLMINLGKFGVVKAKRCLGGSGTDLVQSVVPLNNGEFVVAGTTDSTDGYGTGNHGWRDAWIMKWRIQPA
ncbi:MAG: hypothetical protein LUQ25_06755 [Methanoregulaceae archaeon]|nr:hypothetical protein [Methanoregulaceae archaeon]